MESFGFGRGRGARGLLLQNALEKTPVAVPGDEIEPPPKMTFGGRGLLGRGFGRARQDPPSSASEPVEEPKPIVGFGRGLLGRGQATSKVPDNVPPATVTPAQVDPPKPVIGRGFLGRGMMGRTAPTADSSVGVSQITEAVSNVSLSSGTQREGGASPPGPPAGRDRPQRGDGNNGEGPPAWRRRNNIQPVGPDDTRGKSGEEIALTSNYIKLRCESSVIYQYHVEFVPAVDSRHMRRKMFRDLDESVVGLRDARAFDGRILYLPVKLAQKEQVFRSIRPTDETPINIRVTFTNETPLVSCPAVYNIIFKEIQHCLKMVRVGRNHFYPENKIELPNQKLEIWPGYVTSVTNYEGGLLLLCDVSHKIIRQETVYDAIYQLQERTKMATDRFQAECARNLIGECVLTRYNNRNYRIDDIAWGLNAGSTFDRGEEKITFQSYFRDAYNITIKDKSQPMLISKPKRMAGDPKKPAGEAETQICLVPELCYMTGLTETMRNDFHAMRDLHQHTRVTPANRHKSMLAFISSVRDNKDAMNILKHWGMEIERDTVNLTGRIFKPEKIVFGNQAEISAGDRADFKEQIGRQKVISALPIDHWAIIVTERDQKKAAEFAEQMKRRGMQMGLRFDRPIMKIINNDRTENYIKACKEVINPKLQLVVAVFPQIREDRYNAFKKICCVENPIPSQGVVTRTISDPKKLGSVAVNIALQINVKLGGELWSVKVPIEKFMCVGIDVYHEGKNRKGRSVGGIVGSMNRLCTRWYTRCAFQLEGQEMVDQLTTCFIDMLKKYYEQNHFLPETIFFYRDGVGDGMLGLVQDHEIPQLLSAFKSFSADYKPKVVFIVVQKRINTRIFVRDRGSVVNPQAGTVLDHTVTRKNAYDFFLVPQSIRQGTVTPSHFVVLYDTSTYKPGQVQMMSFKTCHLYYNWPGTVRVPAPCLYAHKVAYLVGQNLRAEPSSQLWDRLFYL